MAKKLIVVECIDPKAKFYYYNKLKNLDETKKQKLFKKLSALEKGFKVRILQKVIIEIIDDMPWEKIEPKIIKTIITTIDGEKKVKLKEIKVVDITTY